MGQQQQGRVEGKSRLEVSSAATKTSMATLLSEAESLLREGRAEDALPLALRALDDAAATERNTTPSTATPTTTTALPALNLVAAIYLELGNAASARSHFLHAVTLDPDGQIPSTQGGGSEKFLWLAQLSEEGGQDSISWFERGAAVLRREIISTQQTDGKEGPEKLKKQLAGALCGMIEVYMTDLSWSPSAEAQCERLISEALLTTPNYASPLQTLASIRISQSRIAEARKALSESVALWRDIGAGEEHDGDEDDDAVPDFPTRISLCRLLMEVEMEEEALGVVERLVQEDDGSVEAWYLGGWCLYLLGGKQADPHRPEKPGDYNGANGVDVMEGVDGGVGDGHEHGHGDEKEGEDEEKVKLYMQSMVSSREWLKQSLKLFEMVGYEDERLRDHARELVGEIDGIVGEGGEDEGEEDEGEEEWDGFGDDDEEEEEERENEDEEMDEG